MSESLPLEHFIPEELSPERKVELRRAMKDMLASEGWKTYYAIVSSQQRTRFDQVVLQPLPCTDAVYSQEYMKGEINGLRTAVTLPGALIDSLEYEIEMDKARAAAEQGDRNEDE